MACNPQKIISALHEERQNITDIVRHDIDTSDRMVLRLIPDAGVVTRDSNQESIIYGEGRQAALAYRSLDHEPRPLVEGQMNGRGLNGSNGLIDTDLNEIDDNACHGSCTIRFAQGFRKRGFHDYGLDVDTQVLCARELDRLGKKHVEGFFNGFRRNFSRFGYDNFSDNLLNLAILFGEANASVLGPDQFKVTAGGWQAPPEYTISIHFLEDYRDHIMLEMELLAMRPKEDWMLEVEMPREDWIEACRQHNIRRNAMIATGTTTPMSQIEIKMLEDPTSPMRGRMYADYGNIRCYFNEKPIRGYFRQTGTSGGNPTYQFTRVYHWKNQAGEEGGVVLVPNHDYREDTIVVNGVNYPMVTLIPHIDPASFKRYRLAKPIKNDGAANSGVNYEVTVRDQAYIANNDHNDKFKLVARHEFRFKAMYPEISGFIAYRHSRRPGYAISVTPRDYIPGEDAFATAEAYPVCSLIDGVTTENCAQCDEVPTSGGLCVDDGAVTNGVVGLVPAGTAVTSFIGTTTAVRFCVRRTGELGKACSVDWNAIENVPTASAEDGVHFTAATGTLNFAVGQEEACFDVDIIGGSGDPEVDLTFRVTLDTAVACTLGTGGALTVVTIVDLDA